MTSIGKQLADADRKLGEATLGPYGAFLRWNAKVNAVFMPICSWIAMIMGMGCFIVGLMTLDVFTMFIGLAFAALGKYSR